ncbi:protein SON-like isoform X2 [Dreissena polymorpha]|uniref:protein SON-like isoform X2 n=1 Tax=Dreissena polymorpha TaxID=45954 RepID=UPI0022652F83|nr:protein SON-like isoform X2 [Dreissena polymorpha]
MDSKHRRDSNSDSDDHKDKKKHKKSKKSSKQKHKSKDKDKYRDDGEEKFTAKTEESENEGALSAIEKFNMFKKQFKKQREAIKKDEGQVVDDLFKEFIASKMRQIENESADREEKKSKLSAKDKLNDEMSRVLDAEISTIEVPVQSMKQSKNEETKDLWKENTDKRVNTKSVNIGNFFNSETQPISTPDDYVSAIGLPNRLSEVSNPAQKLESSQASLLNTIKQATDSTEYLKNSTNPSYKDDTKMSQADSNLPVFGPMLPPTIPEPDSKPDTKADAKKPKLGFKNFGIKLTATSAELIQSGEIIKKGKRLEDGEVVSSSSGAETHSQDSDGGSEVSGTGSIQDSLQGLTSEPREKSTRSRDTLKKKRKSKDKKDSSKEKERESSRNKRKDSGRSKSRSPKRSKRSRSRSKERSRHRSGSKERSRSKRSRSHGRGTGSRRSKSRDKRRSKSREKRRSKSRDKRSKSRGRRSRSKGQRSRSRSRRSRSAKSRDHRSKSKDKSRHRRSRSKSKRSKSKSPDRFWRSKYGDFDAFKFSKEKNRHRSRSKSPDKEKKRKEDLRLKIDKAKLREIAMANALNNAQAVGVKLDVTVKAGGKSVEELTEYCKKIQQKEQERKKFRYDQGYESSSSEEPARSGDEDDFHHPFKVKEAGPAIKFDIPNAKTLPVVTPQERLTNAATLRLTFPVSSGSQHRDKEWVPVEPEPKVTPMPVGVPPPSVGGFAAIMPPPPPPPEVKVFEEPPVEPVDISAIVSERLNAVRKLQENPNDIRAKMILSQAQSKASQWAQSKNLPGKFIGSTGANILSPEELMGDKKRQAWVKKALDDFVQLSMSGFMDRAH